MQLPSRDKVRSGVAAPYLVAKSPGGNHLFTVNSATAGTDQPTTSGQPVGWQHKENGDKISAILQLTAQGKSIASISRTVGLSRQWVYELIRR